MCKTEIHLEIEQEGRNVYGEPLEPVIWDGLCNYQDSGKTVLTAEKAVSYTHLDVYKRQGRASP